jgi:hypothetical protein
MRIQRPNYKRNPLPFITCGCVGLMGGVVLVVGIVMLLLLPSLPGLTLQFSGFTSKGNTETVFQNPPPAVTVAVQNAVVPQEVTVNLGTYGSQPITVDSNQTQYDVAVGTSNTGAPLAVVTFTESGLMDLCYQRADLCSANSTQYRNARIDLRPGGGIIYADVYIPEFNMWQPIGVVLRLDNSHRQFEVAGVDVGGVLYDLPPNELGNRVNEVARVGNDILNQLTLDASGGRYALTEVQIDDNNLTLVMH